MLIFRLFYFFTYKEASTSPLEVPCISILFRTFPTRTSTALLHPRPDDPHGSLAAASQRITPSDSPQQRKKHLPLGKRFLIIEILLPFAPSSGAFFWFLLNYKPLLANNNLGFLFPFSCPLLTNAMSTT